MRFSSSGTGEPDVLPAGAASYAPAVPAGGAVGTADFAQAAVSQLYEALVPDARRLAFLLTGDYALAEDISHEAFLRVTEKRSALRDPGALPAYLRRAVVNEVRSRRRSLVRRHGREAQVVAPSAVPSSADQVEQRVDLFEALQRLPLRQRTAILLRYWQDLTEAQIAAAMDCPVGTVKSALSRGLQALRTGGDWS